MPTRRAVKSAELEQALLLLPFTDALRLLGYLVSWLRKGAQVRAGRGGASTPGGEAPCAHSAAHALAGRGGARA